MWCTSLTQVFGPGGAGAVPTTSKLSGMFNREVDSATANVVSAGDFTSTSSTYAMSALYGSQGDTIAENAFIWSQKATFSMLGPEANASGVVHLGHFTLSSLISKDVLDNISVTDLFKSVHTKISVAKSKSFYLHNFVINHGIANAMNRTVDATTGLNGPETE